MSEAEARGRGEIWIEKYRPQTLSAIAGHADIVGRLESYVAQDDLPHLLFTGPAGVGKTTSAMAIAREVYGDDWRENFLELNASDERGIDVVVAGLCVTYEGEPFAPLPALMASAEEVVKLTAVCTVCGADAAFHVRLVDDGAEALRATAEQVGGAESYQARCRAHRAADR